jgi:hypothetical protein
MHGKGASTVRSKGAANIAIESLGTEFNATSEKSVAGGSICPLDFTLFSGVNLRSSVQRRAGEPEVPLNARHQNLLLDFAGLLSLTSKETIRE